MCQKLWEFRKTDEWQRKLVSEQHGDEVDVTDLILNGVYRKNYLMLRLLDYTHFAITFYLCNLFTTTATSIWQKPHVCFLQPLPYDQLPQHLVSTTSFHFVELLQHDHMGAPPQHVHRIISWIEPDRFS